jgi:hypothetical protein
MPFPPAGRNIVVRQPSRPGVRCIENQELMGEAERWKRAGRLPDPGFITHVASVIGLRLRAIRMHCSSAKSVRRDSAGRSGAPVLGGRAFEV